MAFADVRLLGPDVAAREYYYYVDGQRVAMRQDGTLSWFLGDHLGSASVTANAGGSKGAELRYCAASRSAAERTSPGAKRATP